jgi:hypothetical protein
MSGITLLIKIGSIWGMPLLQDSVHYQVITAPEYYDVAKADILSCNPGNLHLVARLEERRHAAAQNG